MTKAIKLDVFVSPTRPVNPAARPFSPPGGLTWPPTSATLVSGERDAVLVDALTTANEAHRLADKIERTGKNLTAIYITHAHGDHLFGAPVLLQRFPRARLVALSPVVELLRAQLTPQALAYWRGMFGDQIPDQQRLPEPLADPNLDLEGHQLIAVEAGRSDAESSTFLHIPSLDAVIAGDIVYNRVHVHLGASNHNTRNEWIAAIEKIAALNPTTVVAGHKHPDAPDTHAVIGETVAYIRDFDRISQSAATAQHVIDEMLSLHGTRLNVTTLWNSAMSLFPPPDK